MSGWKKWLEGLGVLLLLGLGAIVVADSIGSRSSKIQEGSSYQAAVNAQSKAEALRFISAFRSSSLVGNLILSLKPDVARRVCTDLPGGGPCKAREACEVLHKIETDAAAEVAMVNSDWTAQTPLQAFHPTMNSAISERRATLPSGPADPMPSIPCLRRRHPSTWPRRCSRCRRALSKRFPPTTSYATSQRLATPRSGPADPLAFHPLPAAPTPIDLASPVLSLPPRLVAAVPSDDEPRDVAATGNTTVRTGGPDAFHPVPRADTHRPGLGGALAAAAPCRSGSLRRSATRRRSDWQHHGQDERPLRLPSPARGADTHRPGLGGALAAAAPRRSGSLRR